MKDSKEYTMTNVRPKPNSKEQPFDLNSQFSRSILIKKSGIDFKKHHRTLELHIYTPL